MKRIRALDGPTPGLADYLEREDEQYVSWDGFRSHQKGAAYKELVSALERIQHGLCGYCETKIKQLDKQVEHVIPQSDPEKDKDHVFDPKNMIVCCKGGTRKTDDAARYKEPVNHNRSCGEKKEDCVDPEFIDPRELPALPSLMRVDYTGRVKADEKACEDASMDVNKVNKTIDILGLNVERLRRAREKHWQALTDQDYLGDPQKMENAVRGELLPDQDNKLPQFFSTSRSYFGPAAEKVLAEIPQSWI